MKEFKLMNLSELNIESELEKIGFDSSYKTTASDKFRYKNIKIYDLTPAQVNIIKQTALSVGADCASHRDVITGSVEKSNAILGGSCSQIKKIAFYRPKSTDCFWGMLQRLGERLVVEMKKNDFLCMKIQNSILIPVVLSLSA